MSEELPITFEDKLKLCERIEKSSNEIMNHIYNIISKTQSELIGTKTKCGFLLNFNKINSKTIEKIINIMNKETPNTEDCKEYKNVSTFFNEKVVMNECTKSLIIDYILKPIQVTIDGPKKPEILVSKKSRKRKPKMEYNPELSEDDWIDKYLNTTINAKNGTIKEELVESDCDTLSYIESIKNSDSEYESSSISDAVTEYSESEDESSISDGDISESISEDESESESDSE